MADPFKNISDEEYDEILDVDRGPMGDRIDQEIQSLASEDQEIGQEIDESEALAQSLQPKETAAPKADVASKLISSYKEARSTPEITPQPEDDSVTEDEKYNKLLQDYQKNRMLTNLLRAGAQISQGFAGRYSGDFDYNDKTIKALEETGKIPLEGYMNLLEKRRKQKDALGKKYQLTTTVDPTTNKVVQAVFDVETGKIVPTEMVRGFATQIRANPKTKELIGIQPGDVNQQTEITRPEQAEKKSKEPIKLDRSLLTVSQNERVDKTREQFLSDTKDAREAYGEAASAKALIQSGKTIGGDIVRAIQNKLARATGERGAMTDRDVSSFGGQQAILDRLKRWASVTTFGELPESDRKFLTDFVNVMEKRSKDYLQERSGFFVDNLYNDLKSSKNLKDVNFDKYSAEYLLGVDSIIKKNNENETIKEIKGKKYKKVQGGWELVK